MKTCTRCNTEFPKTTEYFLENNGFNRGQNDGFQSVCVSCRSKSKKKPRKKEKMKQSTEIFKLGRKYKIQKIERGVIINYFEGELIQITNNFITLKNKKHGFCESFKPIDFKIRDYSIQEVK